MANIDDRARSITGSTTSYLVRAGDYFREDLESRNIIKLLPGIHQGFSLTKPFTQVGAEPGAIVNRLASAQADAVIDGVYFRQDEDPNNVDHLVRVSGNSSVLFTNCVFQRKISAELRLQQSVLFWLRLVHGLSLLAASFVRTSLPEQ